MMKKCLVALTVISLSLFGCHHDKSKEICTKAENVLSDKLTETLAEAFNQGATFGSGIDDIQLGKTDADKDWIRNHVISMKLIKAEKNQSDGSYTCNYVVKIDTSEFLNLPSVKHLEEISPQLKQTIEQQKHILKDAVEYDVVNIKVKELGGGLLDVTVVDSKRITKKEYEAAKPIK